MANEEKIVNKIITIDTIVDLANYLEDKKEEYQRLFEDEENKNKNLAFNEKVYKYKQWSPPSVEYEITFKDNKSLRQQDYNWFIGNLATPQNIKKINIYYNISYKDNSEDKNNYIYRRIHASVAFYEDTILLNINSSELENETYQLNSYIRNVLENNENRYNKTIKNRNARIQSFCFSIGIVLSYIIYIIILCMKDNLPEIFITMLNNKYFLVFGQWLVAGLVGNLFGYGIMMSFYKDLIPKKQYSHYSSSSHKRVYVENIEDFVGHDEVQIGSFANNGQKRLVIEKIYKITNKIVLIQLILSVIFFVILK